MISQSQNRVQAIKSKFENLNNESIPLIKKNSIKHLIKQNSLVTHEFSAQNATSNDKENINKNYDLSYKEKDIESDTSNEEWSAKPNMSYLYNRTEVKRSITDSKISLTRQISDPGKKLHRSHAFRCDRSQKVVSPKRHGSCNGRSESADFSLKMGERRLSKDKLKRLGNLLEDQMRKENFVPFSNNKIVGEVHIIESPVSIPDTDVPQHILDQYAKVIKPKKKETQDAMTDSGVSSETENLDDEKSSRVKKIMSQFEKTEEITESKSNLESLNNLAASSETMYLARKNPHLVLTDTLKKALKQPLPPGPPPKKPPRVFQSNPISESPEKQKKDTKKMLEKLEQVLLKRESQNHDKTNSVDNDMESSRPLANKPKEIHYLCTEILNITNRTLLPNQNNSINCFKSLNCAIDTNNSTLSLPYTRLSSTNFNRNSLKYCCPCNNNSLDRKSRLSTFLTEIKCPKCEANETNDGFKCHLSCKCKGVKSEFFIDKEHIYDEPFIGDYGNKYGTLNHSKSMEDLRTASQLEEKIYDIPCDISRPATPEPTKPRSDFEKLRQNFENGFRETDTIKPITDTKNLETAIVEAKNMDIRKFNTEKPPMKPKPVFVKNMKMSKSTEDIVEKDGAGRKFGTEVRCRRVRDAPGNKLATPKRDTTQLDVDRENLNRLMNEIYETVSEACNMDTKPGSFPTEQSDSSTSEDSVKLTRSLTEKRKNYVRRVSSRVAYLDQSTRSKRYRHQTSICSYKSDIDNPYSTFRSWKSFRTSQSNINKMDRRESTDSKFNLTDSRGNILSMKNDFDSSDSIDNLSIDEKTGCVDIALPFEPRERGLFNISLLVGLNYMTGQAYVKSVFPNQVQVPPHIENLIFPETLSSASKGEWTADAKGAQCYSLVLTDERGERSYGYCRRVLPEGATTCLPLCYCVIGKYRAPGFYYKILQEIESHHGGSDVEIHSILQQLFETDLPHPGEDISITFTSKHTTFRNSINLGDVLKCKTMPDLRKSERLSCSSDTVTNRQVDREGSDVRFNSCVDNVPDYYDLENNNGKRVLLSLEGPRTKVIKRPLEPRIDEDNLSVLLDCLGAGLTIKVFGSLLLERKVLIIGDKLSQLSSCMEALQSILYPFVWQQPLISVIPSEIQRDVLEAPLPILAGMLKTGADVDVTGILFEEGMLIDLTQPSKVIFYQGDESTILPTPSYKTLKTSLQMEAKQKERQEDSKTRNIMISEAFLRFFVDILGDFWRFFAAGEVKDGDLGRDGVIFDKESFVRQVSSKQNQYFLEWFTETAMFNHFVINMATRHAVTTSNSVTMNDTISTRSNPQPMVDMPLPDYYELFDDRLSRCKSDDQKCVDGKTNYKNAVNKRVKLLKMKLRELVT